MSDVAPTGAAAGAPAAPAAPAPDATAPTLNAADLQLIAQQVVALLPQPAPPSTAAAAAAAAAAPVPETSPVNLFAKGQMVAFSWTDHYDGPCQKVGVVVDVLPDEGAGARSIVGWFSDVSGPIGDHLLAEA